MITTVKNADHELVSTSPDRSQERVRLVRAKGQAAGPRAYRRLLIATDFSRESLIAARAALVIAPKAEVMLAHAYRIADQGLMLELGVPAKIIRSCLMKAREVANQRLDEFAQFLGDEVKAGRVTLYGQARRVIPDYAACMGVDLVALGCEQRSFLGEFFAPGMKSRLAQMKIDVVQCKPLPGAGKKRGLLAAGLGSSMARRRLS